MSEQSRARKSGARKSRARNSRARKGDAPEEPRHRDASTGLPVSKMRGPGDVAVMIPYLLGFQPVESLVVVSLEGSRKRFGPLLRVDLVDHPELREEQARRVVDVISDNHASLVLVAAFSVEPGRADSLVGLVLEGLAEHGIAVEEAFRADGRRWWSYVCHNSRCCSPEGTSYDAGTARVAAEAVMAGMAFAPDRDALRLHLAPDRPEIRRRVARSVTLLRGDQVVRRWRAPGAIETAVLSGIAAPTDLSAADTAWLALAVQTADGAGRAMAIAERETAAQHYALWRTVTRRVDDDLLPAVACLAGFAAWLEGRGVLASHAVDRVLEVAPGHPFAELIAELLDQAVNPRTWPDIRARRRDDGSFPPPAA